MRTNITKVSFLLIIFATCWLFKVNSQTYPFTLPATVNASFNVSTKASDAFKKDLLGYNIYGFTKTEEKALIRALDPPVIRFPVGAIANWYDWTTDGYSRFGDTYNIAPFDVLIDDYVKYNTKAGFPGLTSLNNEKKTQNSGIGYDILWIYNILHNSPQNSVDRLRDSDNKGFDVKYIELGNETFYTSGRSTAVRTDVQLLAKTKAVAVALKNAKPSVQVALPISWKEHLFDTNTTLADDNNYFDAITVHKYLGGAIDAYSTVLTSRLQLAKDVNAARSFAPGKPVWLTEWAITAGDECQAACALAMADCYLYLFENQDKYDHATWFSANGTANSFITFVSGRTVKFPLELTGYGQIHAMIRSVFEGSKMLPGTISTSKLTTADLGATNAVNAITVLKDGKITVFVVNLTDKLVNFDLNFDGNVYEQSYTRNSIKFSSLNQDRIIGIDENPYNDNYTGISPILLPKLSVSAITLNSRLSQTISFNAIPNQTFGNTDYALTATSTSGLKVSYTSNNPAVATIVNGKIHIVGAGSAVIKAIQNGNEYYMAANEVTRLLTVTNPNVTTRIEAESFTAKTTTINTQACSEGTDNIGWIINGNYCDYALNVAKSGTYKTSFRVASFSTGGTIEIYKGTTKLGSATFAASNGWQTWVTVNGSDINLSVGAQTIRLKFVYTAPTTSHLMNVNWFEISGASAVKSVDILDNAIVKTTLNIFPNPVCVGEPINIEGNIGNTISVYNALGEIIESQTINDSKLVLSSISKSGFYFVKVGSETIKLIVK